MSDSRAVARGGRGWPLQAYFAAVGVVVVVAGVAAAAYVSVQSNTDARQVAIADVGLAASKAATQIDAGLKVIDSTSNPLVTNDAAMRSLFSRPTACSLGYAPLGAFETGRIELIRLDGTVICSSTAGNAGKSYAGQSWLAAQGKTVVAPIADPIDGHRVAAFVYPVKDLGVLAWFVDLAPVGPKLGSEFGSGVNQLEFLVVSTGGESIVTRSIDSSRWTGKSVRGTPFAGAQDSVDRLDVDGAPRWYGVATVAGTGWKVYAGADRSAALAAAARLQQRQLGIIGFGVLLTLLALVVVYRQVARPMASLDAAVRASRDFEATVPVSGPAQVAALGAAVNDLIGSLKRESADRETAERSYAELFEGNPLPSLILRSKTLEIVDVNEAAVDALGYSRDELKTMKTADLVVPEDSAQAARIRSNRESESPTTRYGPLNFRRKDGSFIRVMGTSYLVDYHHERLRIAMLEDVTEKEKIERQMQQAQRLESLGQLAGGVAHDFNNLLTVILNVTASLKDSVHGDDAARDVDRVEKAAKSASRLTHQLLAFARCEVVALAVLNVSDQLADLRELLARTIGSHINLTMDLAADTWPVLMDRGQVEQIVINLAVNARDAMPRGGTLAIRTANVTVDEADTQGRPGLQAGHYVQIQVSDSGSGMDKATLDHAFEPFFTTKPVGQGTGLGLATVYGITKQVTGHVSIYSEVGHGTTVTVLIPRTEQAAVAETPAIPAEHRPASGTILVVEDYPDLRELFDEILSEAGYHVLTAGDGSAAIAVAAEHEGEIDLLLTDVVMPNMLGTDLARELQSVHPDLRVLFMSGHAQPVIGSATPLPAGAKLLQKPFMEAELLAKLGEVLSAPSGHKLTTV